MKLIKKMAEQSADEYVKDSYSMSADQGYGAHVDGYEAGFRAAREMAAQITAVADYTVYGKARVQILNMGEEEV